MPFSKNAIDGTRIHYEVAGSGPPLLLIHGFGGSIFSWTESPYADALKFSYRLVMYDMRAHGHSGHPHGVEAYTPEMHVADALAVLDELGIEKSHVSGYSMGAWVGFGLLKYAPERMRSFVAGANHPYPRSDYPTDDNWIELYREGLEAVLDTFEGQSDNRMAEPMRTRFLAQDSEALVASMVQSRDTSGLEDGLSSVSTPVLAYAGTEDSMHEPAAKAAAEIPGARFIPLEGLDHMGGFTRSDLVIPMIKKFLADVKSADASARK